MPSTFHTATDRNERHANERNVPSGLTQVHAVTVDPKPAQMSKGNEFAIQTLTTWLLNVRPEHLVPGIGRGPFNQSKPPLGDGKQGNSGADA